MTRFVCLLALVGAGCAEGRSELTPEHAAVIEREVDSAMRAFEAAERSLDVEGMISFFGDVPEFRMYMDTRRITYDALVAQLPAGFEEMAAVEGGFTDIEITALSPHLALASAPFRGTYTDTAGNVVRQRGVATWIWRQLRDDWRIIYGDVDHYPDEEMPD